jgi:membrane-associated phospholipid phosphatase
MTHLLKIGFLFLAFSANAQTKPTIKEDLLSPVTTNASSYFWTGTALTTFLVITQDYISYPLTERTYETRPLGDAAKLGDLYGQLYPNILYTLGALTHGYYSTEDKSAYEKADHMFRATLYSGFVVTVLKYTVREPRPNSSHEKNSFPSGHSTTAFAFATVIATEHSWHWGVPAMTLAALTGFSRMNDERHFLHDVIAGMTLGVSYGLGTYYTKNRQDNQFIFVPILDLERAGLRIVKSF